MRKQFYFGMLYISKIGNGKDTLNKQLATSQASCNYLIRMFVFLFNQKYMFIRSYGTFLSHVIKGFYNHRKLLYIFELSFAVLVWLISLLLPFK